MKIKSLQTSIILAGLILPGLTLSYSEPGLDLQGLGKGPYVGFSAFQTQGQVNYHTATALGKADSQATTKNKRGEISIGYGETYGENVYWGAELGIPFGVTTSTQTVTLMNNNVTTPYKLPHRVNIRDMVIGDVLAGYLLNDHFLTYVRFGIAAGRLKFSQSDLGQQVLKGYDNAGAGNYGGRFGVGFDAALNDRVAVGLDYTYTIYGTTEFKEKNLGQTVSLRPRIKELGVHLKYLF